MTKPLVDDDKIKRMWCEDVRKVNAFTDASTDVQELTRMDINVMS